MRILNTLTKIIKSKVLHTYEFRPIDRFMQEYFNGRALTGVEVGVCKGTHADALMHHIPIKKLYLVDSYVFYEGITNVFDFRDCENKAKKLLKPFNDRINFIKDFSKNAVDTVPNNLDFCYIDANHSYDSVKQDIELWYPKVKSGGVFGGHDYCSSMSGVCRAVDDFIDETGYFLNFYKKDWWIIKK